MANGDAVRDCADVYRVEPPAFGLSEALWVAEDPRTGFRGVGRVEAEAVGNLLALLDERDPDPAGPGYVRLPGRTVQRRWTDDRTDDPPADRDGSRTGLLGGLVDRVLDR